MSLMEQQTYKNFLIFQSHIDQNAGKIPPINIYRNEYWIWSDRLVLIEEEHSKNDGFWNFIAFDLLMNEYRQIRFPKISQTFDLLNIYPLNGEFGFIVGRKNDALCVNIVKINWDSNEFQLIDRIEQKCTGFEILIDKMEPSKFALKYFQGPNNIYQVCELVEEKIELKGKSYQSMKWFHFYSKNRLINFQHYSQTKITVHDLMSNKEQIFEIDRSLLPENVVWSGHCEWINDRLYVKVQFGDTEKLGLMWADLETTRWQLLDFKVNSKIEKLITFNGCLIVNACRIEAGNTQIALCENKFFNIPMRRPNHLRRSAWILVVNVMKQRKEKDWYEAAKEFLPLNSDLREIWFKYDEQKMEI